MTDRLRAPLPRLCAITDRALAGGIPHEEIVRALVRGGALWVQLREKALEPRDFLEQARAAVAAAGREREASSLETGRIGARAALVLVNDRVDIAIAAAADGAHVGREDLPPVQARRLLGGKALLGVSTHSLEEGIAAAQLPVDYVAIGPVFPTSTKPGADPVVGIETVRRLSLAIRLPVVGIGGIGASNVGRVLDAGASAVAVISALYGAGRRIEENLAALLRSIE